MPEWLKDWWPLIALAYTTVLLPTGGWIIRTGLVSRAEFEAARATEAASRAAGDHQIGQLVEGTTRRLDRIETNMSHLPDQSHAQRMEIALAELRGQVAVLNERLMPVAGIADRLQEFLLERAK